MDKKQDEAEDIYKEIDEYILEAVEQDDIQFEDAEEQKKHALYVRSKAVKRLVTDYEKTIKYLKQKYDAELSYSTENWFPKNWMKNDKEIRKIIGYEDEKICIKARYPKLIPIMNYIHNLNRRKMRKKDIDLMKILASGEEFKPDRPFACFITNRKFYDDIVKALGISESTAHRYIKGLLNMNAVRVLEQLKFNRMVLSDGYYLKYQSGYRKISFMQNNAFFRQRLRAFKPA